MFLLTQTNFNQAKLMKIIADCPCGIQRILNLVVIITILMVVLAVEFSNKLLINLVVAVYSLDNQLKNQSFSLLEL
jgi:hypothetical protein